MSITRNDVAQKAKVSSATVSRVLNNDPKVEEETRRKVLDAIEMLNYIPNISARILARSNSNIRETHKTGSIGILEVKSQVDVFSKSITSKFGERFELRIISGILEEANSYKLKIQKDYIKYEYNGIVDLPGMLRDGSIDGLIIILDCPERFVSDIKKMEIPTVFIDSYQKDENSNSIVVNDYQGGYDAVKYLVGSGHKEIGVIGGYIDSPIVKDRLRGAMQALSDNGLKFNEEYLIYKSGFVYESGYEAARELIERGKLPTAFFVMNDFSAIGAKAAFEEHGLKIPEDMSLVGFDDTDVAAFVKPSLTTMRIDREELGRIAVKRLHEVINDKNINPIKISVPVKLIERESVRKI